MSSSRAREVGDLVDLAVILDPWINIAIWRRQVDPRIVRFLERPECTFRGNARLVAHAAETRLTERIAKLLPAESRRADPIGAAALTADAKLLAEAFSELVAADEMLVSFEEPDTRMCPRFHVDRNGIRLLVTYLGPGTEWLPHEHVDRRWLGRAGAGRPCEMTGLMRPGAVVRIAPTFAVVLLKGDAWPGAEDLGAVHRSPDPAGQRRVLLRIDMLSQVLGDDEEDS